MNHPVRRNLFSGFTLLEIVLALGLSAVLLYLVMMATELHLHRVDRSRTRVESSQVARAVLDSIANDLQSTRFESPNYFSTPTSTATDQEPPPDTSEGEEPSGGGPPTNGPAGGGGGDVVGGGTGLGGGTGSPLIPIDATTVRGIYGDAQLIRIDNTATYDWHSATRTSMGDEPSAELPDPELPQTVFYTYQDGQRVASPESAGRALQAEPTTDIAGLYRENLPSAVIQEEGDTEFSSSRLPTERARLLAPEVVSIEFSYFDGYEMLDYWDSVDQEGLPAAVEIRLRVLEVPYEEAIAQSNTTTERYSEKDIVEYRRYVNLSGVKAQPQTPISVGPPEQTTNRSGDGSPGQGTSDGGAGGETGEESTSTGETSDD
ncbi:PulJ/GspJ family protein [Adhaeretor mobilis]|uniref:Prepilin-type N-terminal cleavage/methylation domain-containing protein n=1 Tax=Adhaeretor mobilis TaxID=1930276 RepID=A0A517MUP3_9BACT|nr:type II secretion system protein [Adhaeretor mobilis]QDS98592.1 hypothetical protein HG15A2_18730 [Adhaeretor mobilis]